MTTTTETNQNRTNAGWDTSVAAPTTGFFRTVLAVSAGALGYLLLLGSGILRHAGRESLAGALSVASDASAGLIYGVTSLVVIFGVVVIGLSVVHPEN
jgi:hypothetical protein